ncbi:hypothetical protein F5X68DRAFT_193992 [Plectosphaerella plurivora]|uniref:Uncharacterized protein n=1 Tax=Plectosphaerella plurivora TaxID=936078 RepID=A0A9P9A553_9PEZI|nr:hypothetical protein F5X68DRAFT_193992 [Plectosphaerella plurivora]
MARVKEERKSVEAPEQTAVKEEKVSPTLLENADEPDHDDNDEAWTKEALFKEPETKSADEIGRPLPSPANYHEDVMLPRAWNAKSIDSECLSDPKKRVLFNTPVRKTKFWKDMKKDPVFWCDGRAPDPSPSPEPTPKQKPQQKPQPKPKSQQEKRPAPKTSLRFDKTPQEILGRPVTIPTQVTPRKEVQPDRNRERATEPPHRNNYHNDNRHDRPVSRDERLQDRRDDRQGRRDDRRDDWRDDRQNSKRDREVRNDKSPRQSPPHKRHRGDERHHSPQRPSTRDDGHRGRGRERPRSHSKARDSSGSVPQHVDKGHSSDEWESRDPWDNEQSIPRRRHSPESRAPAGSGPGSRQSSVNGRSSSRSRSRSSRPTSRQSQKSGISELSWLEAALLGRPPKDDSDSEIKAHKPPKHILKPKRRAAPQMDSAFGRRW